MGTPKQHKPQQIYSSTNTRMSSHTPTMLLLSSMISHLRRFGSPHPLHIHVTHTRTPIHTRHNSRPCSSSTSTDSRTTWTGKTPMFPKARWWMMLGLSCVSSPTLASSRRQVPALLQHDLLVVHRVWMCWQRMCFLRVLMRPPPTASLSSLAVFTVSGRSDEENGRGGG